VSEVLTLGPGRRRRGGAVAARRGCAAGRTDVL